MKSSRLFWTTAALSGGCLVATYQMGLSKAPAKTSAKTSHAAAVSPALIAKGKQLVQQKRCNTCHGADLNGKPKFAPSLHASGSLKEYNPQTWARVMDTGVTEDGGKVKRPMPVYHMKAPDSAALYAYLKTLK